MHALSKRPDGRSNRDDDARVVTLESDDCADVLSAVSSDTARAILLELQERPLTASEIATTTGTSIQNVKYHLTNLEDAGLIEVTDRVYSQKGREMKIYAPTAQPLLLVAGSEPTVETDDSIVERPGAIVDSGVSSENAGGGS